MSRNDISTRRTFLKAGAVLSAPLAAAPVAAFAGDSEARLARLEDENAIRVLHQTWLRSINAGTAGKERVPPLLAGVQAAGDKVRSIAANHAAPPDVIMLAADGRNATGRFHCTIGLERPIAQDCTLAQMAHLQGGGFVRRTESRVLIVDYVKAGGAWSIARVESA
ncbi:MAG TPA: hypothetical protein VGC27_00515 [Rhizomicrobium sp.]